MSIQSLVVTFVAGFPLNLTQPLGIILVEIVLANRIICGEKKTQNLARRTNHHIWQLIAK
jgi:hypothetical protein